MFDICLQNPPYERNLHVDFVVLGKSVAETVGAIHPSTPMVNRKPGDKPEIVAALLDLLDKHEASVYLFDGNAVFNAGFFTPLSVTVIRSDLDPVVQVSGLYEAEMLASDINQIGEWVLPFYHLTMGYPSVLEVQPTGEYWVSVGDIRGHPPRDCTELFNPDFFTIVPAMTKVEREPFLKSGWTNWGFATEQEANNFLSFLKTKFVRFMVSLYKVNAHLASGELGLVPWMDFTQEWDDSKLFKIFGVSDTDRQKIEKFIPDYY